MRVPFVKSPLSLAVLCLAAATAGCSSVNEFLAGDKLDYRSQAKQTQGLDVPPDLTQLARDGRYQAPGAVVSASGGSAAPAAAAAPAGVAVKAVAGMSVERDGQQRWLKVPMAPEQLWPELRSFWLDSGFALAIDNAQVGVLETEWAENRAKLPQDLLRKTLGRVIEGLYDTGERDRFRMRVERTATGSEIYITHRGLTEVFTDRTLKDDVRWQVRPTDPQLEAEFLTRLMVRLGSADSAARAAVASSAAPSVAASSTARARLVAGQPTMIEMDDDFERAWRRVGLALDRSGFTVEDRNRADGVYFVRYIDGVGPDGDKRGFFARLFSSSDEAAAAQRFRVAVRTVNGKSMAEVQTSAGQPANNATGQRIASVLATELAR